MTLGFSPCPNDTFIFHAMTHGLVDTEGLTFEVLMEDVEQLNQRALKQELDITKLSYHAWLYLMKEYTLLGSGSALGNHCGPLLISKRTILPEELPNCVVAIPGEYTTANYLLSAAFPVLKEKKVMLFSDIEKAVLDGSVDAGLIIHENRFTYAERGLQKIQDLGEWWEDGTGFPIPLGGIVARSSFGKEELAKINRVLRRSVEYAFAHPEACMDFVREHAQEMDESVMLKHIQLYVNDFSVDLGTRGRAAIHEMHHRAVDAGLPVDKEIGEMAF